jgi:hypothetical protein
MEQFTFWHLSLAKDGLVYRSATRRIPSTSFNPVHGEVYSIQHYVIKFVSDLWQVGGFSPGTPWPPRRNWNIVESSVKHNNPITPFSPKMGHKSKPDVICIGLKLVSISDEIDNEKYTLSKPCKLYLVNLKKN